MDIKQENEKSDAGVNDVPEQDESVQSRRKFTRGAALGGAVLLTLGNRAAWSQTDMLCVSTQNWTSFTRGNMSLAPSTEDMAAELGDFDNLVQSNGGEDFTFANPDNPLETCTALPDDT